MPPFDCHTFVCCNERAAGHPRGCCQPAGQAIRDALKEELRLCRRSDIVARVNQAGCLDQCEYGPTVVIYPQGIWYGRVRLEDVPRIVQETILNQRVLEDLRIPDECLNSKGRVPWSCRSDAGDPPTTLPPSNL